jgi:hypothetical protein
MVAGFSFFFLALALYGYLIKVSPSSPDPSGGRICPMYEHAYVFFVTADQRFGFAALMGVFALLVLIPTVLSIRWKEFQSPRSYIELFKHLTNR